MYISKSEYNFRSLTVDRYVLEMRKTTILTREQEQELFKEYHSKNTSTVRKSKIREKVISSNLRFAYSAAKQYQNRGLGFEDILSLSNIGLIVAFERFDYTLGFKFISYAINWIKRSILESLYDHKDTVRIPTNVQSNRIKVFKLRNKYDVLYGEEYFKRLTTKEIAELANISEREVHQILMNQNMNIYNSIDDENEFRKKDELYISYIDNHTDIYNKEKSDSLQKILKKYLTPQELFIVTKHFGLDGESPMTLQDIGEIHNISRERVRQILNRSKIKMKHKVNKNAKLQEELF